MTMYSSSRAEDTEECDLNDQYEQEKINMTITNLADKKSWHIDSCALKHISQMIRACLNL